MEIKAQLNYLHIAPRKVRLAAGVIKGMTVKDAEHILHRLPKRSAAPLLKLMKSAVGSAVHDFRIATDDLRIQKITVDPGPVHKKTMPRAFGRAAVIRKRTSHVVLVLTGGTVGSRGKKEQAEKGGRRLREASPEEIGALEVRQDKKQQEKATSRLSKPKSKGFIKRVFQRKAI